MVKKVEYPLVTWNKCELTMAFVGKIFFYRRRLHSYM